MLAPSAAAADGAAVDCGRPPLPTSATTRTRTAAAAAVAVRTDRPAIRIAIGLPLAAFLRPLSLDMALGPRKSINHDLVGLRSRRACTIQHDVRADDAARG